ncbi:MAG: STN domain-containing protein [Planctomycetota bacterium]|nr:STN domain-containing protein [Planctomycetota bacterium]
MTWHRFPHRLLAASACVFGVVCLLRAGEAPPPEKWEDALRKQLERKVSFKFVDTPLCDAIAFFTSFTKQNIIVGPDALKDAPAVTLEVKDLSMSEALKQVLDKAGLEFQQGDMALYIVKKGTPQRELLKPITPVTEWEKALHKALQRKVTFEFVDTPLDEAFSFLRSLVNVPMMLDPKLLADDLPTVNLRVTDMTLETALMWILRMNELHYQLRDEALFIYRRGAYASGPIVPLTPAQLEALNKVLPDLAAQDFEARQRATKVIEGLGPAAAGPLQAAVAKATDPEARMRIKKLLDAVPVTDLFAEPAEVTKALDALERPVSFEFVDTRLDEDAKFLSGLSDTKVTVAADAAATLVNLRVAAMRLGNAIRWTARLGGARIVLKGGVLQFVKRP